MVQIHNTELLKELKDGVKLQQLNDVIPSQLDNKVIPVMEVNPKLLRRCNIARSGDAVNATGATIYTTPADKEFFLVSMQMSVIKDATSTSNGSDIKFYIEGLQCTAVRIAGITLTAQSAVADITLVTPIKIDKGTNITINNAANVANIRASGTIIGYTVDNSKA